MKTLNLNQMENVQGGISCSSGLGFAVGFTAVFVFATIATGGAAALALGSIASFGAGSMLSVD
ncbi:MAG: hypothetical protein Q4A09_07525, partial [Capnocytophaga felis]|nr:hypothetical protein [Capnocytophaga felis]